MKNDNTVNTQISKVVDALIKSMAKCFSDIDSGLLECTKMGDLSPWPPKYADAVGRYQISSIYKEKTLTHTRTHVCELSFLLYCLRLLVFLVSHLEES